MMKSTISPPKVSKSTSTFTLFGLHSTTKFRAKSTIYIYPSPPPKKKEGAGMISARLAEYRNPLAFPDRR